MLAFDNRDMGRSDHTLWPYLVAQMANDAVAVLDATDEPRGHVYRLWAHGPLRPPLEEQQSTTARGAVARSS